MTTNTNKHRGFTIVELLIVIVVIGILAAITIVAFNGIQKRARDAGMASTLQSAAKKARAEQILNGAYPPESQLGSSATIALKMTGDASAQTFCITGTGSGYTTKNVTQIGTIVDGPCDGHSGGAEYCPDNSYVKINGYYCEGSIGSVASLHSNTVKLAASSSPIPTGAPGEFVGRQSSRDNLGSNSFAVAAGEVYCASGWATTVDSAVVHRIGIMFSGSYGNSWQGAPIGADSARNKWVKASGCHTAPTGTTSGRLWTQNDGTNGTTADPFWYQTAIQLTKQ